jgi:hypothetical protein
MIQKSLFLTVCLISSLYAPKVYKDYSGYTLRGGPKDAVAEVLARYREESREELAKFRLSHANFVTSLKRQNATIEDKQAE